MALLDRVVLIANVTRATEGHVVIINHLPSFLQRFFTPMRAAVSRPQFSHLWSLVLAVVVNLRDAKLLHLSSLTPAAGHRTRRGAFYLCPAVANACRERGFTFFSVAQRNRRFTTDDGNGKRRKLADAMPGLLKHRGRDVHMKRSRGHAKLRLASVDGHLSRRIGR